MDTERDVPLTGLQTGDLLYNEPVHELNTPITDLQWSQDRTYFITACKDKTSKVWANLLFRGEACMLTHDSLLPPRTLRFSRLTSPIPP